MELLSVPVIVALVSAIKMAGLPSKFAPLLSIAFGVASGLLIGGVTVDAGVVGLLFGLSASGLYSGGKAMLTQ